MSPFRLSLLSQRLVRFVASSTTLTATIIAPSASNNTAMYLPCDNTTGPSSLLQLPFELRTYVLRYLLPNQPTIDPDLKTSESYRRRNWMIGDPSWASRGKQPKTPCSYCLDGDECHTAILRVNRQLHGEGTDIMYHHRNFVINLSRRRISFLRWTSHTENLQQMPAFHYGSAGKITIRVIPFGDYTSGHRYANNLTDMCNTINCATSSLQMLQVLFHREEDDHSRQEPLIRIPFESILIRGVHYPLLRPSINRILALIPGPDPLFEWLLRPLEYLPPTALFTIELPSSRWGAGFKMGMPRAITTYNNVGVFTETTSTVATELTHKPWETTFFAYFCSREVPPPPTSFLTGTWDVNYSTLPV